MSLGSTPVLSNQVEALDVFVDLLARIDGPTQSSELYDRLCEACCRLASMQRALLFIYDRSLDRVRVVGSFGVDRALAAALHVTLDEARIAQRALAEDAVIEVSEDVEGEVPTGLARLFGITTVTCTPVSAGGHWFGVLCADRGGGRFTLTAPERHAMWSLGKLAALATSAATATWQQERARRAAERIALTREIHERVIQRLFGVMLALEGERELTTAERRRAHDELQTALTDLRSALTRPVSTAAGSVVRPLRAELERLAARHENLPLKVDWASGAEVPVGAESLAQEVVAEALRNAAKHARPSRVDVRVATIDDAFELDVSNDGASARPGGTGMGLRLVAFEALAHGGVLEFGSPAPGRWHVRLVLPLDGDAEAAG